MATLTSRLIVALTDQVSGPARGIGGELDRLRRRASRTSRALLGGGGLFAGGALRNLMAVGAGYVGVTRGIGGTVGAALKFEEAFSDVRKVLNGTPAQLAEVRHEILEMSKRLPNSAEGISEIFAAAAQSNIPLRELGKFSEMVAKVSVAWDLAEAETSQALAEIKNQLHLNVDQIGLYADAINHLSNNTAARAPDLVDFSKRVAAQGELFGFTSEQTLAFGGAMIASGAQTNVAATSFRNMGMALADAAKAPKAAQAEFKKLGLNTKKLAKQFNTDAVGTMMDVFERIQALPEHERLSTAIGVFGREARALMPLINNSRELRRQLALVANETEYAGSAAEEFAERASTTSNALRLLGNRVRAIGIGIGDGWLPTIRSAAEGIGDVLLTLGDRVGVLDTIQTAFTSFMTGLGGNGGKDGVGGIRQLMNDLGDAIFGEAFEAKSFGDTDPRVVALAKTSNTFRAIGRDLRAFAEDIRAGNIGQAISHVGDALSKMSGGLTVGGAIAIALTGRALLGLAAGAAALALSKTGRIFFAAMAIASLIDAVKEAESLGQFVDNLKALGGLEWAAIGAGILMLVGPTAKLAGAAGRLGKALGRLFRSGKPPTPAVARTPSSPSSPSGSAAPSALGPTGKGFQSPWSPKSAAPAPIKRGPTGTPISRPPAPSPMMQAPVAAPTGWGAALKNFFGKGGLIATGMMWAGEAGIRTGLEAVNSRLYTPEQRAAADAKTGGGDVSTIGNIKNLFESLRGLDNWLADKTGLKANLGEAKGSAEVDIIGVPEVSIPAPITFQPSGTQDVRVTNPMPAPQVSITVHAQTNDPQAIASAVERSLSAKLTALYNGAFHDEVN